MPKSEEANMEDRLDAMGDGDQTDDGKFTKGWRMEKPSSNREDRRGGLLVKHPPKFIRWKTAGLREAQHDQDGYYLKVDGDNEETKKLEQIFLYLPENDVVQTIQDWAIAIIKEGSPFAKWLLASALNEIDKEKAKHGIFEEKSGEKKE